MTAFPTPILDYWHRIFAVDRSADRALVSCVVSEKLNPRRPAMLLKMNDGSVRAIVRPQIAERAGIGEAGTPSVDGLKRRLAYAGVMLHDPDYLCYLPADARQVPDRVSAACRLTDADRTAFETFYNAASEQDREDAWVELNHWSVFGCFDAAALSAPPV